MIKTVQLPSLSRQVELDPSVLKFSIIIHSELSDPLIVDLINSITDTVPDNYRTEILLVENLSDVTELDQGSIERKSTILERIDRKSTRLNSSHDLRDLVCRLLLE